MTASTLMTERVMTRRTTMDRFRPSANCMIGVIHRSTGLAALQSSLAFVGISANQISVLDGVADRGRSNGAYSGVVGRIRGWFHGLGLGPEAELACQHDRELASGNIIITIRDVSRDLADDVRNILVAHNGWGLQHYGRFSVAILVP